MKLIFRGDPLELERGGSLSRQSITIEGVMFPLNQPVDASGLSDRTRAKLAANSHFEVVSEVEAPAAEAKAEEPAARKSTTKKAD